MKKINIAELLKDCPRGMELDCTMYDNLYFDSLNADYYGTINCYTLINGVKTSINFTKYGTFNNYPGAKCVIFPKGKTTWEGFQRPFKDGDIIVSEKGDIHLLRTSDSSYCAFREKWRNKLDRSVTTGVHVTRFATEEEKQKLFDAIKENGYKWNHETKTLEKLEKEKFDITSLKPFESKVLARNFGAWEPAFWGYYSKEYLLPFVVVGGNTFSQCIPYKGNEHLLGTTNDCDEYFKTWE